jgi:hypothetical protein
MVLTEGSAKKMFRAVQKAGDGAYHIFDYSTQQAVIMKPVSKQTLAEWMAANPKGGE